MNIQQKPPPSQPLPWSAAAAAAIEALKVIDPSGRHNLVAIHPENGVTRGRTFEPYCWDDIAEWVDLHDGEWNCHFSANEPRANAPHKKLFKEDIGAIRCLYVDKDPKDGVPLGEARRDLADVAAQAREGPLPPTLGIDSGGGIQLEWNLDRKLDPAEFGEWAEQQGRGLASLMASDPVQNIDRLLRLPGTLNIPNAAKLARGRVPRRASTLYSDPSLVFTPRQFAEVAPPLPAPQHQETEHLVAAAREDIEGAGVGPADFHELPKELRDRFGEACQRFPRLNDLWVGREAGLVTKDTSGSGWRHSLADRLAQADGFNFTAADYAALAFAWALPQVESSLEKQDPVRALARDWGRLGAPVVERRNELLGFHEQAARDDPVNEQAEIIEAGPRPATELFEALSIGDLLRMPDPRFVIDRHLPERSMGFLYGEPGSKKSFLALDWGLHLAFRRSHWHGYAIDAKVDGVVVYLAGEGAAGFKVRVSAWMNHHQIPRSERESGCFRLIRQSINFMDGEQMLKLARTLRQSIAAPVVAVIVDTVSRSMPGADENTQKEMTRFVQACKRSRRCSAASFWASITLTKRTMR